MVFRCIGLTCWLRAFHCLSDHGLCPWSLSNHVMRRSRIPSRKPERKLFVPSNCTLTARMAVGIARSFSRHVAENCAGTAIPSTA